MATRVWGVLVVCALVASFGCRPSAYRPGAVTVAQVERAAQDTYVLRDAEGTHIRWEAEDADETNFDNWGFHPTTLDRPERLSAGTWLSRHRPVPSGGAFARWKVTVPRSARYHFYVRKFWRHGAFRWRFGQADWHEADDLALVDRTRVAQNVAAYWANLGQIELEKGEHVFEIELLADVGERVPAAFDCFVLSEEPWSPRGRLYPGETTGNAMNGYWAFEPGRDGFKGSPIDLRWINDHEAGEKGFVQAVGEDLAFSKTGEPVRFWGVTMGNMVHLPPASADYLAQKLAKNGVNMVRIHTPVFDRADPRRIDVDYLTRLHYLIHTMGEQGIYTALSIYYPRWIEAGPAFGLEGYEDVGNKTPAALLFFDPDMQELYKSWARQILTSGDPDTGVRLVDNPALAIVEIANEDSYFFPAFNPARYPAQTLDRLQVKFEEWLTNRYGSLEAAYKEWGEERPPGVEVRVPLLALRGLIPRVEGQAARPRAQDQVRFLTEELRGSFEEIKRWMREQVGVKCAIVGSNWPRTVFYQPVNRPDVPGLEPLEPLEAYANAVRGLTADTHYYWGGRMDTGGPHQMMEGDLFDNSTPLDQIPDQDYRGFTFAYPQVEGHPQIVSDFAYEMPNLHRNAPLVAAVQGLQNGFDAICFFAQTSEDWENVLGKWPLMEPAGFGQFPAAALLFRKGYVREEDVVVRQVLRLEDLYRLERGRGFKPQDTAALRQRGVRRGEVARGEVIAIDPLAHLVGRVVRVFVEEPPEGAAREEAPLESSQMDLAPYVDRDKKTAISLHGEVVVDYGRGVMTVNAPRAQGATGRMAAGGVVLLDDVDLASGNPFATVCVISLDDRPIASAKKLLVQVMSRTTNHGLQSVREGDRRKLVKTGSAPINVEDIDGWVTIKRADAAELDVTALDANGYPLARLVETEADERGLTIQFEPDVFYYYVKR